MARRVFFSFHYENDIWRANQVRHSWVTKSDIVDAGFVDAADFEEVKKGGDTAIKKWIDKQLEGTSVTVVLIGSDTSNREYIKYELEKSWARGNGILGIFIHQCKNQDGKSSSKGDSSFGDLFKSNSDSKKYFLERFETYDWIDNDGYANIGKWIEIAAKKAGR
jgi:hypothetical protein